MMKKNLEESETDRKRPLKGRMRFGRDAAALKTSASKTAKLARLERQLSEARAKKKSSIMIRLLRRQIEMLRSSEPSRAGRFKMFTERLSRTKEARVDGKSSLRKTATKAASAETAKPLSPKKSGPALPLLQVLPLIQIRSRRQFVPQAIVSEPVKSFADHESTRVIEDVDALDHFEGVAFALEGTPFTVMHYRGHPDATSTIYLPKEIADVDAITESIAKIIDRFGLPKSALIWQRRDNPDL